VASDDTLWIARAVLAPASPQTFRCPTGGLPPGPDQRWTPIDDPFFAARWASGSGGDLWAQVRSAPAQGEAQTLTGVRRLPPTSPTKVLAIGRNYAAHARELGNEVPATPLSFLKPPSCLQASGEPVRLPRGYARIDMEAELVVVIGARASAVRAAQVWPGGHVAGYLLGNDLSCRDLQRSDKQWTRAKGFDGFGPVSAALRLTPPGQALASERLRICGYLDDVCVQDAPLSAMIFDIPTLIEHLSACMTLEPGDLLFTGTPEGVSALSPGQVTRVELEDPGGPGKGFTLDPLHTPLV